jgi:hypothetical protein
MTIYFCKYCNYYTHVKQHFSKHNNTSKHKNNLHNFDRNLVNVNQNCEIVNQICKNVNLIDDKKLYLCCHCNKSFKHRQAKSRHMKYNCPVVKEKTDINTLTELLNEKNEEIENKDAQLENKDAELKNKDAQIKELMQKLQCQFVTNNGTIVQGNQQNIANIQLLNYNKTDYEFLSDNDYLRCFMDNNHCVKKLIEKVHFNPKKPENMNVYISCIKGKYVMVYRDNTWQIRDRQKQIDDLYETNELMLENWYDEYKETYPDIIKSFTRYLKNKANDTELIRSVKDEILMMLYNKRDMIQE